MIIALLIVLGLGLGSFVNALVWRVHMQSKKAHKDDKDLSIIKGRSICPHCKHKLASRDLIPVLSWVTLRGACRYCKKPISSQYPLVELATAALFLVSYYFWPFPVEGDQALIFSVWLVLLTGLMALVVFDFRWKLLPNRIMYPLGYIAGLFALLNIYYSPDRAGTFIGIVLGVVFGGGIFYLLYQVSKGKWIGGGDVRLGWLLGAIVGSPSKSILFIFLAALMGTLVSVPLMANKRLSRHSTIPFGPFLIAGAFIAVLFGSKMLHWYQRTFLI